MRRRRKTARKRERSPSACVEHEVIRDEPGHGGKRHKERRRDSKCKTKRPDVQLRQERMHAKSTLGLDFDLQDINLKPSALPGEELQVKRSRQIPACPARPSAMQRGRGPDPEPTKPGTHLLSLALVWVRIPSMSPVTVSRPKGGGGGGRWTEEDCWEGGGGGRATCLRLDFSSSSCLRNRLFSLLREVSWREKKKDLQRDIWRRHVQTERIIIVLKGNLHGHLVKGREVCESKLVFEGKHFLHAWQTSSNVFIYASPRAIEFPHEKH
ncbi:hypothetical protein F7725_028585 [Dissostichus mawsoni]|uniref:Uncharacterized protein n=1 Tax=Dissostichus mawsoni TaxID=36200 RepID=A0A7J5XHC1_DISMA|nr:hypothetical protein F7725_028585 [Dissostichus mawsoni]